MRISVIKMFGASAAAVVLVATASCASSTKSGQSPTTTAPPTVTSAAAPTTTPAAATTTTTTTPTPATMDVRVYFMHGDKLDVAHRTITATRQVATAAMAELLSGPTSADTTAGLTTTIPTTTRLRGITIAGGLATVDLTGAFASGGGSLSMAGRLAQVTYTLTQFPTVNRVVFHLDGQAVTVFGGEGIMLDHPATRASFEDLTPPILVEFPSRGWAVQTPLEVSGTANVFEAQLQAEITDATGKVISTQAIHATSGTGTRGTFDVSMSFSAHASGPATLTVFDLSAKNGSRIDVVTVPLQLAGG